MTIKSSPDEPVLSAISVFGIVILLKVASFKPIFVFEEPLDDVISVLLSKVILPVKFRALNFPSVGVFTPILTLSITESALPLI